MQGREREIATLSVMCTWHNMTRLQLMPINITVLKLCNDLSLIDDVSMAILWKVRDRMYLTQNTVYINRLSIDNLPMIHLWRVLKAKIIWGNIYIIQDSFSVKI